MEKPSKTFLIRGGIALAILVLIFVFQSDKFQNLFSKKESTPEVKIESLEELIKKDSNGNGIPDWEERFWGLDPMIASTNGQLHTEIIAQRKTILSSQTNAEDLNETERLARELFISATIIGGSTNGDLPTIRAISEEAADQFTQGKGLVDEITIVDIARTKTNKQTITAYIAELIETLESKKPTNELEVIALVSEKGDLNEIEKLAPISTSYKVLAQKLTTLSVPTALAEEHLILTNSINNMGRGLETFKSTFKGNAAMGIIGFYQYSAEEDRFDTSLETIIEKSNSYFIIP
jgi:hypothetical protein